MKPIITAMAASVALLAVAAPVQASEALAKNNGCLTCHAVDKKKVGPGLKDAAASLKKAGAGTADKAVTAIKAKHSDLKAKDDDLKAIAGWILAM